MTSTELSHVAEHHMLNWNAKPDVRRGMFADKEIEVHYSHFKKTYKGLQEMKSMLQRTHTLIPDLKINIKSIIPGHLENHVTVEWTYTGTHRNGKLFGVESSGKPLSVNGVTILKIKDGRVREEKGIVDNLSLVSQIGAFPPKS